eukprot:TRINITY_DN13539_c0_g1_i1.p1 TRINITY_DN13539_c0_g1~~TRINITY_DN13539_c0_g1_i1.p1  ORF type:complete len:357 (+),score=82.79 TRINITY_DN13539_c0_g1_i1:54-1124(+)
MAAVIDEDVAVFGKVDDALLGVLHRVAVLRKWSEKEIGSVIKKLLAVDVRDVYTVMLLIRCNVLQKRLKAAGQKTFKKDTLMQIRNLGGFGHQSSAAQWDIIESVPPSATPEEAPLPNDPHLTPELLSVEPLHVVDTEGCADELTPEEVLEQSADVRRIIELELGMAAGAKSEPSEAASVRSVRMDDFHLLTPIRTRAMWRVVEVPLDWLYFYQTCVAGSFSDGKPLQETIDELRSGMVSPYTIPLMHALCIDGRLYGMGTRRLLCFHTVWGSVYPEKKIPILFCNHSATGATYNECGLHMRMFGQTRIDGGYLSQVSRRPPRRNLPRPTARNLQIEYQKNRMPVSREGTNEVYWC